MRRLKIFSHYLRINLFVARKPSPRGRRWFSRKKNHVENILHVMNLGFLQELNGEKWLNSNSRHRPLVGWKFARKSTNIHSVLILHSLQASAVLCKQDSLLSRCNLTKVAQENNVGLDLEDLRWHLNPKRLAKFPSRRRQPCCPAEHKEPGGRLPVHRVVTDTMIGFRYLDNEDRKLRQ